MKPFHLALFMNFRAPAQGRRFWSKDDIDWMNGEFHVEVARAIESAGFDLMLLEDSSLVPDVYAGSLEIDLKHGLNAPKHDPLPLAGMLAHATSQIGIVPTLSTSFYPPFLLARALATLDHLSNGRIGWNIVTSSQDRAAQNFGMDSILPHDLRYEQAEEYLQLVKQLWDSWDADARVLDEQAGIHVDHNKVRKIDFEGRFFKCRGPLNTLRPPQGRPMLCQAGQSPAGLAFAARHADTIIVSQKGVSAMKAGRARVRDMVAAAGRNPDSVKVMFLIEAHVGTSLADAEQKRDARNPVGMEQIEVALGLMSGVTEIDFAQFPLDEPLPTPSTEGHRGILDEFLRTAGGRTLREVALGWNFASATYVGTAGDVADQMAAAMQEIGGDGFMITGRISRDYVADLVDLLAPELRARGLACGEYQHAHLRDNLTAF